MSLVLKILSLSCLCYLNGDVRCWYIFLDFSSKNCVGVLGSICEWCYWSIKGKVLWEVRIGS